MKKIFLAIVCIVMTSVSFAQYGRTTQAERIANGCGNDPTSRLGSAIANQVLDNRIGGAKYQKESCNQHDKDYYNGVDKQTADRDFTVRSPLKGIAVQVAAESSQKAYDAAQEKREKSQQLQSTWEKENNQCLNTNEYYVRER